jgi:hypothetical protein
VPRLAAKPIADLLTVMALHRKNALFYRTLNGAQVGDLFVFLIHGLDCTLRVHGCGKSTIKAIGS